ncbi:LuxR C-terminal-related transcriptional regulator [Labrys sp. WJW]|uniref:helix-turn-helix transcriptional regulator n=1 Tax=Labrys sp. WJW TaxID=1737983 RepID=UPI0012EA40C2|nr:LuxR C-terminal-related transcriptional regulator [Labrys sp. WJW]
MTSKLSMFSQFVVDLHQAGRRADRDADLDLAAHALELLRPLLGFDCAWYGWARFLDDRTTVPASSTLGLPEGFAPFWSTMASQDLVATALRRDRGRVCIYDRGQPRQTDEMAELSERYGIRKWASAMHNRPGAATAFFVSVYRTRCLDPHWDGEDLQLLQCAVDHLFLALQATFERRIASGPGERATLVVDEAGFAHLGLDQAQGFLRTIWPGWSGDRLPRPLRQVALHPGIHLFEHEGVAVNCRKDREAGRQSSLLRLELSLLSRLDRLSPREREVAHLLAGGATHKQAAQMLGSAPATIRNQTQAIYDKLGVRSRAQLASAVLR